MYVITGIQVTVQISSATRDLMLIQLNMLYWISSRSGVAELIWTVTGIHRRLILQTNYLVLVWN